MAIELTTASAATLSGIQVFTSALSPEIMFPNAKLGAVASAIFTGQGIPVGDTVDFSHPTFRKVQYVSTSSVSTLTKIIGGQNQNISIN
jgi:hypothetical protein